MGKKDSPAVADTPTDNRVETQPSLEENLNSTEHAVIDITDRIPFPAIDETTHKFVAKGTFDNPAFDGLSETPESTWKPGSLKFSLTEPTAENENVRWDDVVYNKAHKFYSTQKRNLKLIMVFVLLVLYNVYLGFAINETWEKAPTYCDGVKFLVIISAIVYSVIVYYLLLLPFVLSPIGKRLAPCFEKLHSLNDRRPWTKWIPWTIAFLCVVIFLVIDTKDETYRLVSAGGLVALVAMGYVFSANRTHVIWEQVLWGMTLQFLFAVAILRWSVGKELFQCVGSKISAFLAFTDKGAEFVFGYLVTGKLNGNLPDQFVIFAFKVLPVILFFSFCTSILYYYGIMQIMVVKVGWLLQNTLKTTACESMNAAGNIFLGMSEAPLLIKPYLPIMTKSEIHAVMTGGFATIAGSVMAAYISFGVSPSHLLSASVMSAPAALAFSKLFYPETEVSQTAIDNIKIEKGKEQNALEAAVNGASAAVHLVANVAANLIVFVAFIYFLDSILSWFGSLLGWDFISFEWLLSKLFVPIAVIMGIEWKNCEDVAKLVGLKTVVNEFVAYKSLSDMVKEGKLTARSQTIATYALCGFSNIASIGIQLGGLSALAPTRKSDLAKLGARAMIAGSAACFMTACIAGALIYE